MSYNKQTKISIINIHYFVLGCSIQEESQFCLDSYLHQIIKLYILKVACCYRPQHSCGKVMFLHLSVSHSVHRGMYPRMHWGRHPLGRHIPVCTGADIPLLGRHIPACTGVDTPPPPTATAEDGTHPTGMHSCSTEYIQLAACGQLLKKNHITHSCVKNETF